MPSLADATYTPDAPVEVVEGAPIETIKTFLENRGGIDGFGYFSVDGDGIIIEHDWLLTPEWYAHDLARVLPNVTRTRFIVRKEPDWNNPRPVTARIEPTSRSPNNPYPVSVESIKETCQTYHPFVLDTLDPNDVLYKCGDINNILREALWQEHGLDIPLTQGGIYNQSNGKGWGHGFIVLPPSAVKDCDEPLIVDGTAKQFCDEFNWPQTLGPQETIGAVHVIPRSHPHAKYYTTERDDFNRSKT